MTIKAGMTITEMCEELVKDAAQQVQQKREWLHEAEREHQRALELLQTSKKQDQAIGAVDLARVAAARGDTENTGKFLSEAYALAKELT